MDETEKIIAKIKDVISNCDVINCTCVSGEETPHDRVINVVGRVIIELQKFISKNTEEDVLIAFHNDCGKKTEDKTFMCAHLFKGKGLWEEISGNTNGVIRNGNND